MSKKMPEALLKNEANYYLSKSILDNLLQQGKITTEEYQKIDQLNQQIFKPTLSPIMLLIVDTTMLQS